jgi:2',3'-cyclic-nucleotide 2'-phosphodiesterase (5'-nucleotidase family)
MYQINGYCEECVQPEPEPVIAALHTLADATPGYDPAMLAARRAAFVKQIREEQTRQMLVDRADEITDALTTPFLGTETYAELERELAEIQIQLEKE